MWIRVTYFKKSIHYVQPFSLSYIDGDGVEEYNFDDNISILIEEDGFLNDLWKKLNLNIDWGDYEFLPAEKCHLLLDILNEKTKANCKYELKNFYNKLIKFCNIAIKYDTGLALDF